MKTSELTRHLIDAPLGDWSLMEAAVGARQCRRLWTRTAQRQQMPFLQTARLGGALRFQRLFAVDTWPQLQCAGTGYQILLPGQDFHRVKRSLRLGWSDCQRSLGTPALAAQHEQLSIAAWRIVILLCGSSETEYGLVISEVRNDLAKVLLHAAVGLKLPATVFPSGSLCSTIVISGLGHITRLMDLAMATGGTAQSNHERAAGMLAVG